MMTRGCGQRTDVSAIETPDFANTTQNRVQSRPQDLSAIHMLTLFSNISVYIWPLPGTLKSDTSLTRCKYAADDFSPKGSVCFSRICPSPLRRWFTLPDSRVMRNVKRTRKCACPVILSQFFVWASLLRPYFPYFLLVMPISTRAIIPTILGSLKPTAKYLDIRSQSGTL